MENITSRANPLCVHFRKLASARSYREDHGEYLCDSPKLLREAINGARRSQRFCTPVARICRSVPGRVWRRSARAS